MEGEDKKNALGYLEDFAKRFLDGVNKAKLQKDIREDMVFFVLHCIELHDQMLYPIASAVSSKLGFSGKDTISPDIFISYQWGRKPQVLGLYKALTSQGFTCWLDIMQMGGGDSLYDKIDKGVRGCRVVVSCVTPKYALSANCRREVSLADALKKPIVPLLLETTPWPPPGPMGPVLTQLLYIDCTDPTLQEKWTGPKFQELLTKIREFVSPQEPAPAAVVNTVSSPSGALTQGQLSSHGGPLHSADNSVGKPAPLPSAQHQGHNPPHRQVQGVGGIQNEPREPQPVNKSVQKTPPPRHSPNAREAPQVANSSCCLIQ